jgi:fused signal recognition particle receptor
MSTAWYVILFALLAVVLIGAGLVAFSRHRREMGGMTRRMRTGKGHATAHTPGHGATPQHHTPKKEPGPSGGVFRKEGLGSKVKALFRSGTDEDRWTQLEGLLLRADLGPTASADLVARVRRDLTPGGDPVHLIREEILAILGTSEPLSLNGRPTVILIVGVNGSGKTTTIGKLATRLAHEGHDVTLAAADTFRAAAGEQLEVWARTAGADLISQDRGADPGAVVFDAVKAATARGSDVLIVDTAGRLHTKQPLMDELTKIKRVIEKAGASVAETLLVLDAQTGQNGIAQAKAFTDAVELTGVVLTKTDGSAKGGVVLAVREELGVPIRFVGVGEGPDDLRPFQAEAFADRLLSG